MSHGTSQGNSHETSHGTSQGTSHGTSHVTSHETFHGTSHGMSHRNSHGTSHGTSHRTSCGSTSSTSVSAQRFNQFTCPSAVQPVDGSACQRLGRFSSPRRFGGVRFARRTSSTCRFGGSCRKRATLRCEVFAWDFLRKKVPSKDLEMFAHRHPKKRVDLPKQGKWEPIGGLSVRAVRK